MVISKKPKLWMCTNCDRAVVVALEPISEISVSTQIRQLRRIVSPKTNEVLRRKGDETQMNCSLIARLLDKEVNT